MTLGLMSIYEVSKYSHNEKSVIRKHVINGFLYASGRDSDGQYTFHPEDVRFYVYHTTGRLGRLLDNRKQHGFHKSTPHST